MTIVTQDYMNDQMVNAVATSGVLDSCHIGLFTNVTPLNNATALSDLVQPSYPGYATQAVTWVSAFQKADTSIAVQGDNVEFQMSDNTTPTSVQGYFLQKVVGSNTLLLLCENFPEVQSLANSLQAIIVSPQFSLGSSCSNSSATLID